MIIGLYVDDLLLVGQKNKVAQVMPQVSTEFEVRSKNKLDEFIGCQFKWNEDQSTVILNQTRIVKNYY